MFDYKIIYGIMIILLLIEVVILRAKLNSIGPMILKFLDAAKELKDFHEDYVKSVHSVKETADYLDGLFKLSSEASEKVVEGYKTVSHQYDTVMDILKRIANS